MTTDGLLVKVGELRVARGEAVLRAVGLGSCVAIALYDPAARIGGLAHPLLPVQLRAHRAPNPGRYVPTALERLLAEMAAAGADAARLHARLVGGAAMFKALISDEVSSIGRRNVDAARAALERLAIPIRGEDVGGERGRSVVFRVADGSLRVTSVQGHDVVL